MKKITTLLGILLLVGAVAVPVMARGPGSGQGGHHMMGTWGDDSGYGKNNSRNLTPDQEGRLQTLDRKFSAETRELQDQIRERSRELDTVLNNTNPDLDRARTLQKELSELNARLDQKRFDYGLEARKIAPDLSSGYGHGMGYGDHMGSGYGHRMGSGDHMGSGYGPGTCWN